MTPLVSTTRFGTVALLVVTGAADDGELPDEERAYAAGLSPLRRRTWVSGRVALRAALGAIEQRCPAVLANDRGAPAMPAGLLASIAHKESVAVAIVQPDDGAGWHLGIDVEHDRPSRVDISRRVLTAREIGARDARAEGDRARVVPVSFSVKEAIYKAIDPICRRYVGFREVELELPAGELSGGELSTSGLTVRTMLEPDPGRLVIEAAWRGEQGGAGEPLIVSIARARLAG